MGVKTGRMRPRVTEKGKRQWEMVLGRGEPFMMLPTDMALWWCPKYRDHVTFYDNNRIQFKVREWESRSDKLDKCNIGRKIPYNPSHDFKLKCHIFDVLCKVRRSSNIQKISSTWM